MCTHSEKKKLIVFNKINGLISLMIISWLIVLTVPQVIMIFTLQNDCCFIQACIINFELLVDDESYRIYLLTSNKSVC